MILPDLIIPTRINQRWQYSGIDSLERCYNKKHFLEFPYLIDYQYNSRGFRDAEWPESLQELQEAVWCIGDSFTVGVGQPLDHIWPQVLSRRLQTRTINISMDGASNDWICRRARQIQTEIAPRCMIVMWSYTHRREIANIHLDDEQRRIFATRTSAEQDWCHWLNLVALLRDCCSNTIESTIPEFHNERSKWPELNSFDKTWEAIKDPSWPQWPNNLAEFDSLPAYILKELRDLHGCYESMRLSFLPPDIKISPEKHAYLDNIIYVSERLDYARDYHHFDILTSEWLIDQILQRMKTLDSSRNDFHSESDH